VVIGGCGDDGADNVGWNRAGVSEFTEAQLVQLAFIHGAPTLLSALDLVDRGTVTVYTSPSAPPIYTGARIAHFPPLCNRSAIMAACGMIESYAVEQT
jgi:hypothetical protein